LSQELECKLICFLRLNDDLFAWTSADMPGIDSDFIFQNLMIDPRSKPDSQKKRKMGEERREAVCTGWVHQRDTVYHVAGQHGFSKES
jgi:hypothetical protein